jgi:DNA processing protein
MELKKLEIKTILQENPKFPSLLEEIPNPASKIYVLGELPDEEMPKIAIVGTRKATNQGRSIAKEMAKKLSERGMIIVSGLAMGIDTASHEGAVAAGNKTIAVLGCGLDTIYPRQNENLARKILELGGAIISEYPVGTPAFPNQFLERNRIISGLSIATIIIEAPKESGALVTARLSAEQGREVFVVPGPINNPNYYGSHKLIRDGARLVTSVEDILEDLSEISNFQFPIFNQTQNFKFQTNEEKIIFETIQNMGQPLNIDKIIELTKLEPQVINQIIAILIINGLIKETEKGYTI